MLPGNQETTVLYGTLKFLEKTTGAPPISSSRLTERTDSGHSGLVLLYRFSFEILILSAFFKYSSAVKKLMNTNKKRYEVFRFGDERFSCPTDVRW